MRRMLRYEVPADDRWHDFHLTTSPLHAAMSDSGGVEFWAEYDDDPDRAQTLFRLRIFGTGHPLPDGALWLATCGRGVARIVWHLYLDTP